MNGDQGNVGPLGDDYDKMMRALDGLPDVVVSRPATVNVRALVLGNAQQWIIVTARQKERGEFIFVSYVDANGGRRYVIPPEVVEAMLRQRDSITKKNRRKGARQAVETKVAAGVDPAAALKRHRRSGKKKKT